MAATKQRTVNKQKTAAVTLQGQGFGKRLLRSIRRDYWLYIFLIPCLVWYAIFCYAPMGGIVVAFKKYTGFSSIADSPWVGLKWFKEFFNSYYATTIISNTIILSLLSICTFIIPIIFALMVNEITQPKLKKSIQTIVYAPHFISIVVLVSMINLFFNTEFGIVNKAIEFFGGEAHSFLTDPDSYRGLYVWSGVWQQFGWDSIIYVAALSAVDPALHEAATLDGASKLQRMIHINIPTIMPTIVIMLIMRVGSIMTIGGDKALLMLNNLNSSTAELISTYVYSRGLVGGDYGLTTAVGLFTNVVNLIMLLIVNKISAKVSDTSLF